jgi:hypothetical protein
MHHIIKMKARILCVTGDATVIDRFNAMSAAPETAEALLDKAVGNPSVPTSTFSAACPSFFFGLAACPRIYF